MIKFKNIQNGNNCVFFTNTNKLLRQIAISYNVYNEFYEARFCFNYNTILEDLELDINLDYIFKFGNNYINNFACLEKFPIENSRELVWFTDIEKQNAKAIEKKNEPNVEKKRFMFNYNAYNFKSNNIKDLKVLLEHFKKVEFLSLTDHSVILRQVCKIDKKRSISCKKNQQKEEMTKPQKEVLKAMCELYINSLIDNHSYNFLNMIEQLGAIFYNIYPKSELALYTYRYNKSNEKNGKDFLGDIDFLTKIFSSVSNLESTYLRLSGYIPSLQIQRNFIIDLFFELYQKKYDYNALSLFHKFYTQVCITAFKNHSQQLLYKKISDKFEINILKGLPTFCLIEDPFVRRFVRKSIFASEVSSLKNVLKQFNFFRFPIFESEIKYSQNKISPIDKENYYYKYDEKYNYISLLDKTFLQEISPLQSNSMKISIGKYSNIFKEKACLIKIISSFGRNTEKINSKFLDFTNINYMDLGIKSLNHMVAYTQMHIPFSGRNVYINNFIDGRKIIVQEYNPKFDSSAQYVSSEINISFLEKDIKNEKINILENDLNKLIDLASEKSVKFDLSNFLYKTQIKNALIDFLNHVWKQNLESKCTIIEKSDGNTKFIITPKKDKCFRDKFKKLIFKFNKNIDNIFDTEKSKRDFFVDLFFNAMKLCCFREITDQEYLKVLLLNNYKNYIEYYRLASPRINCEQIRKAHDIFNMYSAILSYVKDGHFDEFVYTGESKNPLYDLFKFNEGPDFFKYKSPIFSSTQLDTILKNIEYELKETNNSTIKTRMQSIKMTRINIFMENYFVLRLFKKSDKFKPFSRCKYLQDEPLNKILSFAGAPHNFLGHLKNYLQDSTKQKTEICKQLRVRNVI